MRILMVTPYPPLRDGIANYAAQLVVALLEEGHEVSVVSPNPSAAHEHIDFPSGPRAGLALAKRVRRYDRLILQWHPVFFYGRKDPEHRISADLGLQVAFRLAPEVEVWMHEFEYDEARGDSVRARVCRSLWRTVDRIYFHSDVERRQFLEVAGTDPAKAFVAEHGAAFRKRTTYSRDAARTSLGIAADAVTFLAIGFIQRHKGFDRAVRAFAGLDQHGARLDIVGSTRVDEHEFLQYLLELEAMCAATPGAHLHNGYVSDELFDRWIVAADVVVLPYREIWSSGVLERASLYDTPVIATRVGGLAHQAADRNVTLVADDAELRDAMAKYVGLAQDLARPSWPEPGPGLRERVQAEVVARAALARGSDIGFGSGPQPAKSEAAIARAGRPGSTAGDAAAPLRRLGRAPRAEPVSDRAGLSLVKRAVRRLTWWQIEPLANHVDALRDETMAALREVEERFER